MFNELSPVNPRFVWLDAVGAHLIDTGTYRNALSMVFQEIMIKRGISVSEAHEVFIRENHQLMPIVGNTITMLAKKRH